MKIRYILKHFLFRFTRAFYHARKFFAVFGLCLMLVVCMFSTGIIASADTVYGITIDESDTLNQTVDPEYNEKLQNGNTFGEQNFPLQSSGVETFSEDSSAQGDVDSLVDSQQSGVTSAIGYVESFVDSLTNFQSSFFAFIRVFETFSVLPVISFLIYASIGVGMLAFFLNTIPALVSTASARKRSEAASKERSEYMRARTAYFNSHTKGRR